ncbi:hypothetical protein Mal15_19230 [Stieleria maiorica]|uniref:DUF3150 domain-containing protein n=1 Tax=Stieleria maiorica TaxID=2795974 RepID=A0A5B9MFI1_9BACT|nr:hypothetical protein [Stieleria maiorica]QEF97877.1 hypothetical protein Mal15_19230 [Stieleria maiorica]
MQQTLEDAPAATRDHGGKLRTTMAAMRLSFTWFGTRKSLSSEQKALAADTFHAEGKYISAGKKLIDTGDASFRAVTSVRTQATAYFKGATLPFPEPGLRLVPQASVDQIDGRMQSFRDELAEAVAALDGRFDELKYEARDRLGDLYCESDYPDTLRGLFEIGWEFPSVEPPDYLRRLNPELYQQECNRVKSRFDEAVQLAEAAFIDELNKMVEHLSERLTGNDDGKPKVFRDSAIENFAEFFDRFQRLNIRSNEELDQVVDRARRVIDGVAPQSLRDSESLRQRITGQLAAVQSSLDGLMVDRPRRNILRRTK